jgi:hypothetical protein
MQSMVRFIVVIAIALVVSCGINSLAMEMHLLPKQAASRTGVVEADNYRPTTFKAVKDDVSYPDFWLVDNVPC